METKHKKTVLVVEDVEEISLQMSAMLLGKGQRVLHATNAEEAIRIAEANRPVTILTDLDLPTFDLLVKLVRGHADLRDTAIAIIDIDGPTVNADYGLKILADFVQLDELIACISSSAFLRFPNAGICAYDQKPRT